MIYIQHEQHGILPVEQLTETHKTEGWAVVDIDEYLATKKNRPARVEPIPDETVKKIDLFQSLGDKWISAKEEMTRKELFEFAKLATIPGVSRATSKSNIIQAIEDYEATHSD